MLHSTNPTCYLEALTPDTVPKHCGQKSTAMTTQRLREPRAPRGEAFRLASTPSRDKRCVQFGRTAPAPCSGSADRDDPASTTNNRSPRLRLTSCQTVCQSGRADTLSKIRHAHGIRRECPSSSAPSSIKIINIRTRDQDHEHWWSYHRRIDEPSSSMPELFSWLTHTGLLRGKLHLVPERKHVLARAPLGHRPRHKLRSVHKSQTTSRPG